MTNRENGRQLTLSRSINIGAAKEKELRDIVRLSAEIGHTSMAFIVLPDADQHYIMFGPGLEELTDRFTFCNYTIEQGQPMIVRDARYDDRFVNDPLVINEPNIRFYAGFPLVTHDGYNFGTLCIVDPKARQLDVNQQKMLTILARQVVNILEFDYNDKILKEQFHQAKKSEINFRSLFENSDVPQLLIDSHLKAIACNKAFDDFIIKVNKKNTTPYITIGDYINEPYLSRFIDSYYTALNGTHVQIDQQINFDGTTHWFRFTFEPAFNPDGERTGVFFNAKNITRQVELQLKLYKQNKSLERIAFIQSHELRKPVASIMGLMNIFKTEDYTASKEELLMMEKAVEELDEKIRMIVNYIH